MKPSSKHLIVTAENKLPTVPQSYLPEMRHLFANHADKTVDIRARWMCTADDP